MADMDHMETAAVVGGADRGYHRSRGMLRYIPGFTLILALYILGNFIFSDPRASFIAIGDYKLSWVEVLLLAAAIVAMAEQIKVSEPGVNNINEALLMGLVAVVQIILFTLGAAGVAGFAMFNNTEFLLLTIINVAQTVVAFEINAATLMRTISQG